MEDAWRALVERFPALAPDDPSCGSRGTRTTPSRARSLPTVTSGGDPAGLRRVRSTLPGAPGRAVRGGHPRRAGGAPRHARDGAVVGFLGRTRAMPARRHWARRRRPPSTRAAPSNRSNTRRMNRWPSASRADRRRDPGRFGVERLAIVHRTGEVPLGEASSRSWRSRRIAMPRSRRPATRSTRRKPAPRSGRPCGSVTATRWIGEPARTMRESADR